MMEAWLRQLALNAQLRTGLGAAVVMWGAIAVLGLALALIFLLIAAFVWLADRYDNVVAALVLGGFFVLLAVTAAIACVAIRRGNMKRARRELELRRRAAAEASLIDPGLLAIGQQIAQTLGWRRAASLAAVALLGAALAREWLGQAKKPEQDKNRPDAP
jgi:hypothetical protein